MEEELREGLADSERVGYFHTSVYFAISVSRIPNYKIGYNQNQKFNTGVY